MIDVNNKKKIKEFLKVSSEDLRRAVFTNKRMSRIEESIGWENGKEKNMIFYCIWENGKYSVALGKPGKEAATEYDRCKYKSGKIGNNPNDMCPVIRIDGKRLEKNSTFTDVFNEFQKLGKENEDSLDLIACLLFRSAFMIDHKEVRSGVWRYCPPVEIISMITANTPTALDVPTEVFLHYLDALAWNEDTKYFTLGYDIIKNNTGRINNLLTCVNIIGVMLGRISLVSFAGSFSRPPSGVSAISRKRAKEVFPYLEESPL